jgi:hypothetical protein
MQVKLAAHLESRPVGGELELKLAPAEATGKSRRCEIVGSVTPEPGSSEGKPVTALFVPRGIASVAFSRQIKAG